MKKGVKHFKASILEKGEHGDSHHVFPEYVGEATIDYLIDFWGLHNDDVISWKIECWEE